MKAIKLMLLILVLGAGRTAFSQSCSCGDWELFTVNNKNYKCGDQIDGKCNVPIDFSARYNCKPNSGNCVARIECDVKKDGKLFKSFGSGPHNYLYGNFTPKSNGVYLITLYPACNGNKCTPCTLTITVKDCPDSNSGADVCNCGDKSTDISTGFENTSKTLIPNGQPDNEWRIIANPTSPTPNYSTGIDPVVANPAHPAWALATSRAKWLKPPVSIDAKVGEYRYQYIFTVPAGNTAKVKISRIGGDDDVELFVDYSKVYSKTGGWAFSEKFVQQQKCIVVGDLAPGSHTITIKVKNTDNGATGAYLEGCYELIPCHCPKGWLSNTNVQDGGVTTDGRCKKLVCSPIGVIPPPNGTSVGSWGFTWGNELWAWGTKENGGAAIDCDVTNLAIIKQKDEAVGIGPNLNPLALCPMGFEWKNGSCNPMPSRIYCNDGKKVIMIRVQGQLINTIYTSEPCDETTWPGQGVDGDGTVVSDAGVIGRELTQSMAVADKNLLNMAEISQLYTDQLPARAIFNMAYIQKQSDMISLVLIYKNEKQDLVIINPLTIENEYLKIAGIPRLLTFDSNYLKVKKIKSVAGSSRKHDYVGHVTLMCYNCGYDNGKK